MKLALKCLVSSGNVGCVSRNDSERSVSSTLRSSLHSSHCPSVVHYLRVEGSVDVPQRDAIMRIDDELALLPEHFLKAFNLSEKFADFAADGLDEPHLLEPPVRGLLARGVQVV